MKTLFWALAAFLLGYGSGIITAIRAVQKVDLSVTAERAVRDVAAAYENQMRSQQENVFSLFEKKFQECVKTNADLHRRVRKLEDGQLKIEDCEKGECTMVPTKGFEVKL